MPRHRVFRRPRAAPHENLVAVHGSVLAQGRRQASLGVPPKSGDDVAPEFHSLSPIVRSGRGLNKFPNQFLIGTFRTAGTENTRYPNCPQWEKGGQSGGNGELKSTILNQTQFPIRMYLRSESAAPCPGSSNGRRSPQTTRSKTGPSLCARDKDRHPCTGIRRGDSFRLRLLCGIWKET